MYGVLFVTGLLVFYTGMMIWSRRRLNWVDGAGIVIAGVGAGMILAGIAMVPAS